LLFELPFACRSSRGPVPPVLAESVFRSQGPLAPLGSPRDTRTVFYRLFSFSPPTRGFFAFSSLAVALHLSGSVRWVHFPPRLFRRCFLALPRPLNPSLLRFCLTLLLLHNCFRLPAVLFFFFPVCFGVFSERFCRLHSCLPSRSLASASSFVLSLPIPFPDYDPDFIPPPPTSRFPSFSLDPGVIFLVVRDFWRTGRWSPSFSKQLDAAVCRPFPFFFFFLLNAWKALLRLAEHSLQ